MDSAFSTCLFHYLIYYSSSYIKNLQVSSLNKPPNLECQQIFKYLKPQKSDRYYFQYEIILWTVKVLECLDVAMCETAQTK